MKPGYALVSVELWTEDHQIITRQETEIPFDDKIPRLKDLTDTSQRATANMVENLKDYLDNSRDSS